MEGYQWFMGSGGGSTGTHVAVLEGDLGRSLIASVTGVMVEED